MLRLVYFEGCPNAQEMIDIVHKTGRDFDRIDQSALPPEDPFQRYSSPTLLWNDRIVFGVLLEGAGGCSLNLPGPDKLKEVLRSMDHSTGKDE
jgi:hypothetical protein